MDERMRFVARLMEGEKMAVLCREFDISRKTGYKLYNRYKDSGVEGLTDRSRRPWECLDFCVMSHTLPERARSSYGEEHNRRIFEGAIGSAVGGT